MTSPLVSIQIITHNSENHIEVCLDAIAASTYQNLEIILIDNNSTDGTVKKVKQHALFSSKKIHSFFLQENLGYAGGHNFASKYTKGKYLFLLNADSTLSPNCIEPLVARLESNSNLFACQPLILLKRDKEKINLTGKMVHFLGYDWIRDYKKTAIPPAGEVDSISGAAVLFNTEVFKKIGRFDQQYFMYYEDSDISWRARLAGYSLFFEPRSILYHDYKYIPDAKQQSWQQKVYYVERNRLMTVIKNYSSKTLFSLFPVILINELALTLYAALSGLFFTKLKSYAGLWRARETLLEARNSTQDMRNVSDAEIVTKFVAQIDFVHFDHPAIKYVLNPFFAAYWFLVKRFI